MQNSIMKWCSNKDLGLFIIRLSLAGVFIFAGVSKFMALDQVALFFGSIGLNPMFVYLVAGVEVLAGVAMLLGVFVQYAGILLTIVMISAIYFVKSKMGFAAAELDIALLGSALGVSMIGAGNWSLDKYIFGNKNCESCAGGVCAVHE